MFPDCVSPKGLTVNLGLRVILRNQEPRCQTPESEN
jgi:hypothetical protein